MDGPSVTALLAAWDQGVSQAPPQRALTLLAAAGGDASVSNLAGLSVGQRDARLLALRERVFGRHLTGLATCPACAVEVEVGFPVADVRVAAGETVAPCTLHVLEHDVTFRVPNSADLAALADGPPTERALLARCLLSARCDGRDVAADALPEAVVAAISEAMGESDPQADVQLALRCPACATAWSAPLDVASFLWAEVHAWAVRLLRDVHTLARAYGWPERDILAMSPWRRQVYLELIAS